MLELDNPLLLISKMFIYLQTLSQSDPFFGDSFGFNIHSVRTYT